MDGRAATGIEIFDSIATLLLALAGLAERAAGRSWPLRWLVLWALRRADTVARDFVADSGWNAGGRRWAFPAVRRAGGPGDAISLAASLRALARIVRRMAAHLRRMPRLAPGGNAPGRIEAGIVRNRSLAPIEPCDTS